MMRAVSQKLIISAACLLIVIAAGFLLVNECAYGGGRGDSYTDCDCLGYEWELIDPARRTVCIGIVRSITCYQFIGGPVVDCESL